MHAIPEKLAALQGSVEALLQRRLVEQKLKVDKEVQEAAHQAYESACRRSAEVFHPRLDELAARFENELPKVHARLDEVAASLEAATTRTHRDTEEKFDSTSKRLIELQAEMPIIHHQLTIATDSIRKLQGVKPELTAALEELKDQIQKGSEEQRAALTSEIDRAQAAESHCHRIIKDLGEVAAKATTEAEARVDVRARGAVDHSQGVEQRLRRRIDECVEKSLQDKAVVAAEHEAALRPLHAEIDALRRALDECREGAQDHTKEVEGQIRREIKEIRQHAEISAERIATGLVAELRVVTTEQIASARREAAGDRASSDRLHAEAVSVVHRQHEDARVAVQNEHQSIREAITAVEQSLTQTIKEASKVSNEQIALSADAVRAELRSEADEAAKAAVAGRDELEAALLKEVEMAVANCKAHAEAIGERCQQGMSVATLELAERLRGEAAEQRREAHARIDMERKYLLEMVAREGADRATAFAVAYDEQKKRVHETAVEFHAKAASMRADLLARIDGLSIRVDEGVESVRDLRASIHIVSEGLETAANVWQQHLRDANDRLVAADVETRSLVERIGERASQQLGSEVYSLKAKLVATSDAFSEEIANVRSEMKPFALRTELADSTAASARVTADLHKLIQGIDSVLDRQRERIESVFSVLSERVETLSSEAVDFKARTQQETVTLGGELSGMRAAATSLTHGVLRALQVIGLLHREIDVLPQRLDDGGRAALVQRRLGVEVGDLLEWEKKGSSLASRVNQQWRAYEAMGASSVLALMERRAIVTAPAEDPPRGLTAPPAAGRKLRPC